MPSPSATAPATSQLARDAHISCGEIGTVFSSSAANQSPFHRNFFAAPSKYKILLAIGAFPAVWGAMIGPERYPVGKKCQI